MLDRLLKDKLSILFIVLLFCLFVGTRLYKLSETPVYPDEITWMVRAKETALAIKTRNLGFFKTPWWDSETDTEAIGLPLSVVSGFPLIYLGKGQSVVSRNVLQDYIAARGSVIIFSAFFICIYYFFAKKLFDKKTAILSSLLLTLDPIFGANSKIVMNDIFLTAFMFISLASYLLIQNNKISILLAALSASLAFLSKPSGLVVLPVFFVLVFVNRRNWKKELRKFILTMFSVFLFISILWPSSWNNLLLAVPEYLLRQSQLLGGGINNFFMGQLTNNPPFYYYPFQLFTRLSPLIILGFVGYLAWAARSWKKRLDVKTIYILTFIGLFLVVISFSAKKLGIRYTLPIFPWFYLLGSNQIARVVEKVKPLFLQWVAWGVTPVWFLAVFVYYFPFHSLYYNAFVGGPAGARSYDLVGLCEGTKPAVDYILKCFPEVNLIGGLGCGAVKAPYYYPHKVTPEWENQQVFYVESYFLQLRKDPKLNEYVETHTPIKVIEKNGFEISYIYSAEGVKNECN